MKKNYQTPKITVIAIKGRHLMAGSLATSGLDGFDQTIVDDDGTLDAD